MNKVVRSYFDSVLSISAIRGPFLVHPENPNLHAASNPFIIYEHARDYSLVA